MSRRSRRLVVVSLVVAFSLAALALTLSVLSCGNKGKNPTSPSGTVCVDVYPGAPSGLLSLQATPGDGSVTLSWVLPNDPDAVGLRIFRKTGDYPTAPSDTSAVLINQSIDPPFTDQGLTNGTTYYYRGWTVDACDHFSAEYRDTVATPTAVIIDPPNGCTVTAGAHTLQVCWINPTSALFAAAVVRRKTGEYPTSPTDGTLVYEGPQTCVTDNGLSPTVTYYYAIYAKDTQGRYSTDRCLVQGVPDYQYTNFSIPPLSMSEKRPTNRCGGDCDFGGHGPYVTVTATLQHANNAYWIEVTMFHAVETVSDYTCIQKASGTPWITSIAFAPLGWDFDGYVSSVTTETVTYTDTDHNIDRTYGSYVIDYMDVMGDTSGDDACNTTEDDTHLHYLVTQTLVVRLRR